MPQQFENPANPEVHTRTTALEILADFPDGVDAIITGVGTGGHVTGCAAVLKPKWPQPRAICTGVCKFKWLQGGGGVAPAPASPAVRGHSAGRAC